MSEQTEHKVTVMRENETLDCVGTCTCGYVSSPSNDRADAWSAMYKHVLSMDKWAELRREQG